MNDGDKRIEILNGDWIDVLKSLPDKSINMVMTSPPYWALRDYGINGQLGLENTFKEYIEKLSSGFDEVKRVLCDDGCVFINIGDTYYTKSGSNFENDNLSGKGSNEVSETTGINKANQLRGKGELKEKNLCNIPARFSIAMQDKGWILRNVIIWRKPNVMPSSSKDRFTVDFEYLFFFVKNRKYYFNQQKVPVAQTSIERMGRKWCGSKHSKFNIEGNLQQEIAPEERMNADRWIGDGNRNIRTTWSIVPSSLSEAHFATYPEELCEIPIKSGCPEGGIVLDPFFGAGTTGLVALKNNRRCIGIELNPMYLEIAQKRLKPYLTQSNLGAFNTLSDFQEQKKRSVEVVRKEVVLYYGGVKMEKVRIRVGLAVNWKGGLLTDRRRDLWDHYGLTYLGG